MPRSQLRSGKPFVEHGYRPAQPAIMIVEDEAIIAKDLQLSLVEMGYDAFAIAGVGPGGDRAGPPRSALILSWWIYASKGPADGIQLAEVLKKEFHSAIIYITVHADDAMVERAKRTEP